MLDTDPETRVRAAAEGYCVALHEADAAFFERLCDARFFMTTMSDGAQVFLDKATFVGRVAARQPFEGAPSFEILSVDVESDMASVKLWVDMAPRRFCDYLGFSLVDGEWRLVTKLFRTERGPAFVL